MRPVVYGDANLFITALEARHEGRSTEAGAVLEAAADERLILITSALTRAETLVLPLRFKQDDLAATHRDVLSGAYGAIRVPPVDDEVIDEAARLRARHRGLGVADAVHLATAKLHRANWFLSDDTRLPGIAGLKVTPLDGTALTGLLDRLP